MAYQNPRLVKINAKMASLPVTPRFEGYGGADDLYQATVNFLESYSRLWKSGVDLPESTARISREHYRDLREMLMSLGADITGLPRRLKLREVAA